MIRNNASLEKSTPYARLKYIRKKLLRLSRTEIENKYGLPAATLKVWENGVAKLTKKGLHRCLEIFLKEGVSVSQEWILNGIGLSPRLSAEVTRYLASDLLYPSRKVNGEVRDTDQPTTYADDDSVCILREAGFFKDSYKNAVVIMVKTDDMLPVYQIGDYVGGRFRYDTDIDSALKRDCIIRLKNGDLVIRRLFKNANGKTYNLACVNPSPSSGEPIIFDIEIECAAPIIWHRMPNV